MKKTGRSIAVAIMAALLLSSCFINIDTGNGGSGSYKPDKIRIMGTAERNLLTGEYEFASAKVKVDLWDITDELKPVNPRGLVNDIEENILFEAPINAVINIDYEAVPEEGYEFDSWKVTPLSDIITENMTYYEKNEMRELIENIHEFMNEKVEVRNRDSKPTYERRRYLSKLENIPEEYLPYITAEYDPATIYVALVHQPAGYIGTGTREKPYSIEEFERNCNSRTELNLMVTMIDKPYEAPLSRFIADLRAFPKLEELKLEVAKGNNYGGDIAILDKFDEVQLINVDVRHAFLTNMESNTSWTFSNCSIDDMLIKTDRTVLIEDSRIKGSITSTNDSEVREFDNTRI